MPEAPKAETKKKEGVWKYLDQTFTEEGLKTDVKITLTNDTLLKFVAGVVGAVVLGTIAYHLTNSFFKPKSPHT